MDSAELPDLVRYWFEFDLTDLEPPRPAGRIIHCGGTYAFRLLGNGVGVTGYDEADCLAIIDDAIAEEPLPPVIRADADVDVSSLPIDPKFVGVPAWRGVWFPPLNRARPGTLT